MTLTDVIRYLDPQLKELGRPLGEGLDHIDYAKQNAWLIYVGGLATISGLPSSAIVYTVRENLAEALTSDYSLIRELAKRIMEEEDL